MKKVFILSLLSLMALPLMVQADGDMMGFEGMMGDGTMWGGGWLMMIIGLIYFALASFVFSLVFWLVYKWIVKK